MKKKLLSLVLTLAMVVSLFAGMTVTAGAEGAEEPAVAKWVTVAAGAEEPTEGWSEPVTLTAAFAAANSAEANKVTYVKLTGSASISKEGYDLVGLTLDADKTMVLDLGEAVEDDETVELAISVDYMSVGRGIQVNGDLTVKNGDMTFTNSGQSAYPAIYGIDVGENGKLTVDNCDIEAKAPAGTAQGIVYNVANGRANITVSNSTIDVDGNRAAYGINLYANAAVLRLSDTSLTVKTEGTESYGVSCTNKDSVDCQIYLSGDTTISGGDAGIYVGSAFDEVMIYAHDGNGNALNAASEGEYIVIDGYHINGSFDNDGFGNTVVYGVTETNADNFRPTENGAQFCRFAIKGSNLATAKHVDPNEVKNVTITVDKSKLEKDEYTNHVGAAIFTPTECFANVKAQWALFDKGSWNLNFYSAHWTTPNLDDDAMIGLYLVGELMGDYKFPENTASVSVTVDGYEIENVSINKSTKVVTGCIKLGTREDVLAELENSSTVAVTGVTLDKESLALTVGGETGRLNANVAPNNASNKAVTWSSNNPTVATVADGVVTAVAPGEATITVTTADGNFTDTCRVAVTAAQPGGAGHTTHCVCGSSNSCGESHNAATEWEAWESATSLPNNAGCYYLTTDVTISSEWIAPDGLVLCLNSYVLDADSEVSLVVADGDFTLTDCKDTAHKFSVNEDGLWVLDETNGTKTVNGGVITGGYSGVRVVRNGNFTMYGGNIVGNLPYGFSLGEGGGIYIREGGAATIYGGTVCGNYASDGGGIYVESGATLNVFGGTITENTATGVGGGICFYGAVNVQGAPVIDNNEVNGFENNVEPQVANWSDLELDAPVVGLPVINITGELTEGAKIGVTLTSSNLFTSGWGRYMANTDPGEYFFADEAIGIPELVVLESEPYDPMNPMELRLFQLTDGGALSYASISADKSKTFDLLEESESLPSLVERVEVESVGEVLVPLVSASAQTEGGAANPEVTAVSEWVYAGLTEAEGIMDGTGDFRTPENNHVVDKANNFYFIKTTIIMPETMTTLPVVNMEELQGSPLVSLNSGENGSLVPVRLSVEGNRVTVIFIDADSLAGGGGGGGTDYNVKLVQNLDNVSVEVVLFDADEYESGYLEENGAEGRGKYALVMISGEDLDPSKITVKANNDVVALNVGSSTVEEGFLQYNLINLTQDTVITVSEGGSTPPPAPVVPVTPPTVDVPVSNNENKVDVKAEVSGKDATIKPLDDKQIEQLVGDENASGDVVVDLSNLGKTIDTAGIPKKTLETIVDAAEDAGNDTEHLVIKLSTAELKLDDAAMRAIVDQADGDIIKFNFDDVGLGRLNKEQKEAVKDMDIRKGYEAYITVNGQRIGDFKGGEVEIIVPYAVPAGENVAGFSVWYIDENGKPEKQKSTYDGKEKCFVVTHFSDYVIVYNEDDAQAGSYMVCTKDETCPIHPYTDASTTEWYHDGVHYCIDNGLMSGYGNSIFKPNADTTRAMITVMLWRLNGSPVVDYQLDFEDVAEGQWYTEAIRWAKSEGVATGYGNGFFGTNDAVTREQMVTILWRYTQYKRVDVSVGESTNILSYGDAFDIAEYAIPAMQWACGSGMVQGMSDPDGDGMILAPESKGTRAQIATMMMRFCENIVK